MDTHGLPGAMFAHEIRLYRLLALPHGDGAHSRYNALMRRIVSFRRAAACARQQIDRGSRNFARITFHHYDFTAQALAKLERGHARDLADVRAMTDAGLISSVEVRRQFALIESALYRYPAVDPQSFRRAVEEQFPE